MKNFIFCVVSNRRLELAQLCSVEMKSLEYSDKFSVCNAVFSKFVFLQMQFLFVKKSYHVHCFSRNF